MFVCVLQSIKDVMFIPDGQLLVLSWDLCAFEAFDHILDKCVVESKEVSVCTCAYQVSCRHCVC